MSKHIIRAYSNNFAPSSGENKILPRYDSESIMVDNVIFTKQILGQIGLNYLLNKFLLIGSLGDAFGIHISANCKGELILDDGQPWAKQEMFAFFKQFK
jgi:hypothetical protein